MKDNPSGAVASVNLSHRHCNLCSRKFTVRTVFDRFCPTCKKDSELLRFYDWLPRPDEVNQDELNALKLKTAA